MLKSFLYLLDTQARKQVGFLIFGFLTSSILDVIGVGLIGLFLGLLSNHDLIVKNFSYLSGFVDQLTNKKIIIFFGLAIIVVFIFKSLLALFIQNKIVSFCNSLLLRLRNRLMTGYLYAPYTHHLKTNSADLIARIQENLNAYIGNVLLPVLNFVSSALIAISILTFLFFLHPYLTSTLFFFCGGIAVLFDFFVKKKLSKLGKILALSISQINKNVQHALKGLSEIRVLGREDYFLEKIGALSREYVEATAYLVTMQQIPRYLMENIMAMFIVFVTVIGITFGFNESAILAMVGMFGAAGARLLPTITLLISTINQIRGYSHHTYLVCEELKEVEQININRLKNRSGNVKFDFSFMDLNNVTFQYPETNKPSICDVNLKINRGQSIGIVGASGAGKSTLVNLILGLLEPQSGKISANDVNIENIPGWIHLFAYIPQAIFILDDSVKCNIALGIAESEIDENRLSKAIEMAQLTEVVEHLPNGIDTMLGENGIRISGGQRQRIALARAFYHERSIIILDEATSSLDNETEKEVINTIKRLKGNKTLIVIAHRLSTVEHCDILYKLSYGKLVDQGTFEQVIHTMA